MERFAGIARRIRKARSELGLSAGEVAAAMHLELAAYEDLESHDDEISMCISLEQLRRLASMLETSPLKLLLENEAMESACVPMGTVVDLIEEHLRARGESAASFSERVGWDIRPVIADPARAWHVWNLDGLQEICAEVSLSWQAVLV